MPGKDPIPQFDIDQSLGEPSGGNYFVAAYPPFSCWQEGRIADLELELTQTPDHQVPLGLYIHIPFCDVRCIYCYYLSYPHQTPDKIDRYLNALRSELELYQNYDYLRSRQLDFIYFGGGTPSLLSTHQIDSLFSGLKDLFSWTHAREVTFECAPKSVTPDKLEVLLKRGVTRISMGMQQLNDSVLRANGRIHLVSDIQTAFDQIQQCGFEVVNVDLIVGLLGETETTFMTSLEETIEMGPDSITIYQLEIPHNTPLFKAQSRDQLSEAPASWAVKRERLERAFVTLENAGYTVRSGYTAARGTKADQFVYQDAQYQGADLIGIGASAFSYLNGSHFQNMTALPDYLQAAERGKRPVLRSYRLSSQERLVREFVLQLKIGRISGEDFAKKFNADIFAIFNEPISELTALELCRREGDDLVLTRAGLIRVDQLLHLFYLPQHKRIRYS